MHQRLKEGWDAHKSSYDKACLAQTTQDWDVHDAIVEVCNHKHGNKHRHQHHPIGIGDILEHIFSVWPVLNLHKRATAYELHVV